MVLELIPIVIIKIVKSGNIGDYPAATYVLSFQKVLSGSGRATRRWSMYFP